MVCREPCSSPLRSYNKKDETRFFAHAMARHALRRCARRCCCGCRNPNPCRAQRGSAPLQQGFSCTQSLRVHPAQSMRPQKKVAIDAWNTAVFRAGYNSQFPNYTLVLSIAPSDPTRPSGAPYPKSVLCRHRDLGSKRPFLGPPGAPCAGYLADENTRARDFCF